MDYCVMKGGRSHGSRSEREGGYCYRGGEGDW